MNTSIEKLAKIGSSLGLSGTELKDWIEKNVQEEEERKQRDIEAEKAKTERERERLREETALITLKLELQQRSNERSEAGVTETHVESSSRAPAIKLPKLPYFQSASDNLHDYLQRFERYARVNGWKEEDWATHLSALLTGSSLEVYSRLNDEEANDYSVLKSSLLRRYNLTEDGFLEKFRKSRPEYGESIEQFFNRIASYFNKWIEMAEKDKGSVGDVIDLVMKEQLMNVCGRELLVFVKERKPTDASSVVELISKYVDAHGSTGAYTKTISKIKQENDVIKPTRPEQNYTYKSPSVPPRNGTITCHICRKPGHMARDCRSKSRVATVTINVTCDYCRRQGHMAKDCRKRQYDERRQQPPQVASMSLSQDQPQCSHEHMQLMCGCKLPVTSASCLGPEGGNTNMPVANGLLNGMPVTVLRDSGCSCVVVKKGIVDSGSRGTKKVPVLLADGSVRETTVVDVTIDCPYFKGNVKAVEMENPLYEVILGNIPGAKCPDMCKERSVLAVETRSSMHKKTKPLVTPQAPKIDVTSTELKAQQEADGTLAKARDLATSGEIKTTGKTNKQWYAYKDGILYRHYTSPIVHHGNTRKQVVVPKGLRVTVMKLAHESVLAGHLAAKKTTERIQEAFYWPSMWTDVRNYCRSCDVCQRCAPKGNTPKVPLQEMPLIETPFSRVAVDLVGPIIPASERGYRYILTVVCYCTRYPEAVALKNINTETVAEGLVDIFSRTGVPNEVLSDRGTQFTSELMAEVCRLLSIRQLMTTPYHPQCNGLVERFNGTLKAMLKRLSSDRPRDWDRYMNAALFAYREAPQESLGFSPFELLFGRTVRGPMTILKELWTKEIENPDVKTTYQYVVDLNERIETTLDNVKNYIDDIIIHTKTWAQHVDTLRHVFQRLRDAGLTARPTKCLIGYQEVEFLGHKIGSGRLAPTIDKVEAIKKALPPESKKQLRSFLGLASFYRRYVPNFAAVTSPLTDAIKNGKPNRVVWDEALDRSFNYVKERLSSEPVLRLPDFEKTFILATDASDTGLGAVLMQEYDDTKYPVMYLSRKLQSNERNYSVVERECLALVWAVKTLNSYLLGREFVIETDHAPLLYLNRAKSENGRLMRWSLLLHQYRFKLRSVKGTENHGPDYLSRLA